MKWCKETNSVVGFIFYITVDLITVNYVMSAKDYMFMKDLKLVKKSDNGRFSISGNLTQSSTTYTNNGEVRKHMSTCHHKYVLMISVFLPTEYVKFFFRGHTNFSMISVFLPTEYVKFFFRCHTKFSIRI